MKREKASSKRNLSTIRQSTTSQQSDARATPTEQELNNHHPIDRWAFYGTWISSTFFLLCNLITVAYTINSQKYVFSARILTYFQIMTLAIAKCLCHFVFLRRLYITFEFCPNLRYPGWFFILFSVAIGGSMLLAIALTIFLSISYQDYYSFGAAALFCGDAVASLVILILFINRLKKVIFARKLHSVKDVNKEIKFKEEDEKMLGVMSRLTLLSSLNALVSLCLFIAFVIRAFIPMHPHHMWKMVYSLNVFVMINAVVNCLSLYLILVFAAAHYDKVCKGLHSLIQRCCEYEMIGALDRHRRSTLTQEPTDSNSVNSVNSAKNTTLATPATPITP